MSSVKLIPGKSNNPPANINQENDADKGPSSAKNTTEGNNSLTSRLDDLSKQRKMTINMNPSSNTASTGAEYRTTRDSMTGQPVTLRKLAEV